MWTAKKYALLAYGAAAVATLIFQNEFWFGLCTDFSDLTGCVMGMAEAVAWSIAWPVYWPIRFGLL